MDLKNMCTDAFSRNFFSLCLFFPSPYLPSLALKRVKKDRPTTGSHLHICKCHKVLQISILRFFLTIYLSPVYDVYDHFFLPYTCI